MRALIILCLLLCAGCSQTTLLTRQDYQTSQGEFMGGDDDDALLDFPTGVEGGDFITTMERGYLSLIQGKPRLAALRRQARLQENRLHYHVSPGAPTFFYVRTPEGYYPPEHEVIWLHLLLGWGYAEEGKYGDAAAQARLADDLLSSRQNPNGHFDDPTLRLLVAGLWTMCDHWQEARLDLRAAADLDRGLDWARQLAAHDHAPAQLFVVMGGPGPDVQSDPTKPFSWLHPDKKLKFVLRGRKSALSVTDAQGAVIDTHLSPDAQSWYDRDLVRERELDDLLKDSPYDNQVTVADRGARIAALVTGNAGQGILGGTAEGALVGASLMAALYRGGIFASQSQPIPASDMRAAALVGAVVGGIVGAFEGGKDGYQSAMAELKKSLDPANTYRYVRYLPEYLWLAWTDRPLAYPVTLSTANQKIELSGPGVVNGTAVTFAHLADARQNFCVYKNYPGAATMVTPAAKDGSCPAQPNI